MDADEQRVDDRRALVDHHFGAVVCLVDGVQAGVMVRQKRRIAATGSTASMSGSLARAAMGYSSVVAPSRPEWPAGRRAVVRTNDLQFWRLAPSYRGSGG